MFLDALLMGTKLLGKNIADSAEQASTIYAIDNGKITFAAVDDEIFRNWGMSGGMW